MPESALAESQTRQYTGRTQVLLARISLELRNILSPKRGKQKPTMKIIVLRIIRIYHRARDVRDISPRIALARHVNLVILDAESVLEVLEELDEVHSDVAFVGSFRCPDRESGADWLFDPGC